METVQRLDFTKNEEKEWFVDLPDYPGPAADLQMVGGADVLLDTYAGDNDHVSLYINTDGIEGGDVLKFVGRAKFEDKEYGAFYIYNDHIDNLIWLCDVTEWLFGGFPAIIYVQRCSN